MNQKQINFLAMFSAILVFLDENTSAWSTNSVVAACVTALGNIKSAIEEKALAQQNGTKGYTKKKDSDLAKLSGLAFKMCVRVKNYAVSINDLVLKQAVDFSKRDLESRPQTEIVNRCRQVADKAQQVVATAPVDFKITAAGIAALQDAIELIEPTIAQRDIAGSQKSVATGSIASLLQDARGKLNELDDLIEGLDDEDSETDFAKGYFSVRKINDRRGRGKSINNNTNNEAQTPTANAA